MKFVSYLLVLFAAVSCNAQTKKLALEPKSGEAVAVFASGCFWCTEHVFEAEEYHQNYVKNNPNQPYVKGVSLPRYNKFKQTYKGKIKPNH